MVTAAVVQDGLDGLITVRIISKARPCAKLTGMIEADLAPISHVSGSHQLGRTLHEVIIFTIIMTRQRAAVQCALLARSQLFEVLAVTARGGRAVHPVPRTRAAMHAEAAVQAREM